MLALCLHCGSRHVTRHQIYDAVTPQPTHTWVPIPHHRFLEQIETALANRELRIVKQAHAIWRGGLRYFALLEIQNDQLQSYYGLVIDLRNSHDK